MEHTKTLNYKVSFKLDDNDELQQFLNTLYEYSTTTDLDTMYCHRLRLNLFHETLEKLIKSKTITRFDTALDIGANAGGFSKILSEAGFKDVYGIDIDDHQLNKAKAYFTSVTPNRTLRFEHADAELLTGQNQYDFIVCSEVIEHTQKPLQVVANIKAMLTENGIAIVSVPNGMSLPFFLSWLGYKLKGKKISGDLKDHMSFPSYRTIKLFNTDDVQIIGTTGVNLFYWHLYKFVTKSILFNRINYALAQMWPFKYFSQFFFLIIKK